MYDFTTVKQNLYRLSPHLYEHLFRLYQISPYAKHRETSLRNYWSEKVWQRIEYESEIIKEYLKDDWTVRHGPFAGMKYAPFSSYHFKIAKVIGFYESPIHQWVTEAIAFNYETILNIGCAEGYYTVGFASTCKTSAIYAYDIDAAERENTVKLAQLNGVEDKIHLQDLCTTDELNHRISSKTLIFCDIEGHEFYLLRPDLAPKLAQADLIVELHEQAHPGVTAALVRRFLPTHRIEIAYHCAKSAEDFPALQAIPSKEYELLFHEGRERDQCWMRLRANPPGAVEPTRSWWPTAS